ncbi:MAG: Polysaccharide deacetylase [Acidobacteria bacterium]|nr:Polysaccharide deacetylase [Acidobacteriota bacterium]
MSAAAVAIAAGVLSLPAPLPLRLAALAVIAGVAGDQAFRRLPAFDPLGRIRWHLPSADGVKRCALTFDDGPSPATAAVLDILAAEGVPATFFVLGTNVERHPEVVQRARDEGHAVGLHGMDHAKLAGAAADAIERQVSGVRRVLAQLGVTPARVYRTPHGYKSRGVFEVARRHGLTLWAWSRGVWDTDRPDPIVLVRRATRLARSGMVLLLHDGRGEEPQPDVRPMLAALPAIIRELKHRGFAFVRVGDE